MAEQKNSAATQRRVRAERQCRSATSAAVMGSPVSPSAPVGIVTVMVTTQARQRLVEARQLPDENAAWQSLFDVKLLQCQAHRQLFSNILASQKLM